MRIYKRGYYFFIICVPAKEINFLNTQKPVPAEQPVGNALSAKPSFYIRYI